MLEIDLALDELTGWDLIEVETQMNAEGKFLLMADYSKAFQARVAAKSARIPVEVLEALPARDFNKIASTVQFFLMGSASPDPGADGTGGSASPPAER